MEKILEPHKKYVGEQLLETAARCLAVVIGVIILGINAGNSGEYENFQVLDISSRFERNDECVKVVSGKAGNAISGFVQSVASFFPVGRIGISDIGLYGDKTHILKQGKQNIPEKFQIRSETVPANPLVKTQGSVINMGNTGDAGKKLVCDTDDGLYGAAENLHSEWTASDKIAGNETEKDEETGDQLEEKAPVAYVTVSAYGNGGIPEVAEIYTEVNSFTLDSLAIPERLGKLFDGWYLDEACSVPFTEMEEGAEYLTLYAGWKDFPGFLSNDMGYITGYTGGAETILDGFFCVPDYENCIGITKDAFGGMEESIFEIYIPGNITYIEDGALDCLDNLLYIEVSGDNPAYYSEKGILYYRDGGEAAYPAGRLAWID